MAVLAVAHHVERPVAGAELRDRRADDLRSLEAVEREADERRARVAGDDIRLVVDRVRDERVHRRAGLELSVAVFDVVE